MHAPKPSAKFKRSEEPPDSFKEIKEMEDDIRRKFEKYTRELTHATHTASMNYEIWWIYKKDRPKYVEIMRKYLGFFVTSIHAHFAAMLFSLCKLYETRRGNINFITFISLIKNNEVENIDIKKIEELLRNKQNLIKKIQMLRGNYFAHINEEWDYDDLLKKVNIKYDDFKELIDLSYNLLNRISNVSTSSYSKNDTYRLLDTLLNTNR